METEGDAPRNVGTDTEGALMQPERFDSRAFSVPDTTCRAHLLDSHGEEAWQSSTAED